ncbi:N-acetyl-beta-glucosaminidase [Legionella birminghamensis]|uniref:beta-N-acetylhexosaminidase n=1 Tax=Legionella birminghamensis TaxID=28083 RepID=A0A378IEE0_9GAMM|nr:N-acetyl-beta-glucosaminidase [Legionella birminghamensis]STX33122.1 N-acetyl-beta-glucosaminidase [Legionella birminghamensis]
MKFKLSILILFSALLGSPIFADEISLRDKIGQMLIVGFEGKTVDSNSPIVKAIERYNLGGVILFDYNYKTQAFDKNIESPAQVKKLNSDLQAFTKTANQKQKRPQLPLIISVDYEGGYVDRLKETYGFPQTFPAADIGQMNEIQANQAAETMADILQKAGFNLDFAPILDVNVNPQNPIIGQLNRSFSADPAQVSYYANIMGDNFLTKGVQCAYKHFPGHGSSTADSHLGFVDVTQTWQAYELSPYRDLLNRGSACGMIMTAHIVNRQLDESGLPATLSYKILTGILRKQLQFNGVIITDDMQMKAVSEHYRLEDSLPLAINAGVDMFIFGNQITNRAQDPKQVIDIIESKVKSGEIKESRIDEAYAHIVKFKQSLIQKDK